MKSKKFERLAKIPVSYTHLDVYKRQIDCCTIYQCFYNTDSVVYNQNVQSGYNTVSCRSPRKQLHHSAEFCSVQNDIFAVVIHTL